MSCSSDWATKRAEGLSRADFENECGSQWPVFCEEGGLQFSVSASRQERVLEYWVESRVIIC